MRARLLWFMAGASSAAAALVWSADMPQWLAFAAGAAFCIALDALLSWAAAVEQDVLRCKIDGLELAREIVRVSKE